MPTHTTPPDRDRLWRGAVLATIGHALWIAPDPLLRYELSWDGINYNRQDSQGTRGTITFAAHAVVGVFRDEHSPRTPWHRTTPYTLADFFVGIPPDLLQLAEEEALQYMFDEHNGQVGPIITTAFWSSTSGTTAAEPWATMLEHGGHLVAIELMTTEEGLVAWQEQYEWSDAETRLLATLFTRRMATADPVPITPEEWSLITRAGTDGVEDARLLLDGLGFILP